MEFVYLNILLITLFIRDVENIFLKELNVNTFKDEKILFVSEEPSLLQCAQRCKFIDKNAIVDFKNSKCTCVKYELDEGQEHNGPLTKIFVNQAIMKKTESTKPPKGINIALGKKAQQSTTHYGGYAAGNAIDGLLDTRSFTVRQDNQWWSVDLGNTFDIIYMIISKANYGMKFNLALIAETRQEESGAWKTCKNIGDLKKEFLNSTFTCDNPTTARYVKIRSTAYCHIHLHEFEVYAPDHV